MANVNNNEEILKPLIWPKVILFGDSLTEYSFGEGYWGTALSEKLRRKCDVLNRGFIGYNTRWHEMLIQRIITQDVAKDNVAFTILLGTNDSSDPELYENTHVPIREFQENLLRIFKYLENVGIDKSNIIMIGPPPMYRPKYIDFCKQEGYVMALDNETIAEYNNVSCQTATSYGIEFLELFEPFMKQKDMGDLFVDGVHFSTTGGRFVTDLLWPLIEKRTKRLPYILPVYEDVDYKNLSNSFS